MFSKLQIGDCSKDNPLSNLYNLKKNNAKYYVVLLSIALCMRLLFSNTYGLWSDELVSLLSANGQYPLSNSIAQPISSSNLEAMNTLSQVVKSTTYYDGANTLLYTGSLHFWMMLFGKGEFTARLFSILCSTISCIVLFRLGMLLFKSERVAFIGAIAFALHPLSIEFAQQARTYSMATLLALISTLYFYKSINTPKTRYNVIYCAFALSALLAHYLTISVLCCHFIVFLFSKTNTKTKTAFIASFFVVVAVFFVWLKTGASEGIELMNQRNAKYAQLAQSNSAELSSFNLPATIGNICAGCLQVTLQVLGNLFQDMNFRLRSIAILLVIPFICLLWASQLLRASQSKQTKTFLLLLLFLPFQLLFSSALAVQAKHIISFQPLYANFIVPHISLALGFSVSIILEKSSFRFLATVAVVSLALIFLLSLVPVYGGQNGRLPKKQALAIKAESIKAGDTVLVENLSDAQLLFLYLPKHQLNYFKTESALLTKP